MLLHTPLGPIRGLAKDHCSVFYGIPYAAPPVGELRWQPPAPHPGWAGTLDATVFPKMAPQPDVRGIPLYGREFYDNDTYFPGQSEDCLYLNIWRPEGEGPFPVAVWIHGGAFDHGYSYEKEFGGEAYAQKGVLLVSIAYRLGPLGFFARPDGTGPVNYGLLDQLTALRWVRDNIAAFGGDPDNVTLFGQSAGAMSTQLLCSSPAADGLFRRAILQSGAGLADAGMLPSTESLTEASDKLIEALGGWEAAQNAPAQDILKAVPTLGIQGLPFAPAPVDPVGDQEARWAALKAKGLTFLLGSCADDMAPGAGREGPMYQGALDFVRRAGAENCRVYYFDHPLPGSEDGSFHSSELWYTFGTYPRCWRPWAEADLVLSREMVEAWTQFMTTGTVDGWPTYDTGTIKEFR